MNSYTNGPWEDVGANEQGERCIYGSDDSAVAVTIPCGNPDQWPDRSISNARLIAAAPVLLEALQMMERNSLRADWPEDIYSAMVYAIAKATGDAA